MLFEGCFLWLPEAVVPLLRAQDPCEPVCEENCTPGTLIPDPHDCHNYYSCLEGCIPTDFAFTCPEGEKFDVNDEKCKTDDGSVVCGTCVAPCRYDCREGEGFAAIRGVCGEYYFCGLDVPVKIYCDDPDKPYFDGRNCVEDENRCCDKCEVYCSVQYTETEDPTSCNHFYYCKEAGFPTLEDRYECPDGERFSNVTYSCMPSAETDCYEPCA